MRGALAVVHSATPSPDQTTRSTVASQLLPDRVVIVMTSPGLTLAAWTRAPQAPLRSLAGVAGVVVVVICCFSVFSAGSIPATQVI